ncbi:hypothetical protein HAX54_041877, partial [Datura stramonium]|nr:hypothetical protein [Datura stramonium]
DKAEYGIRWEAIGTRQRDADITSRYAVESPMPDVGHSLILNQETCTGNAHRWPTGSHRRSLSGDSLVGVLMIEASTQFIGSCQQLIGTLRESPPPFADVSPVSPGSLYNSLDIVFSPMF